MSEIKQRTLAELDIIAAAKGLVYFIPEKDELFLDIDKPFTEAATWFADHFKSFYGLEQYFAPGNPLFTISVNGNTHMYIQLGQAMNDHERLILQACFGSDPRKELISLIRLQEGSKSFISLFETQPEANRVREWRVNNATRKQVKS